MAGSLQDEMKDLMDGGAEKTTLYANAYDWFFHWMRNMYKRRCGTTECKWRSDWFNCPEARSRITELWRAWEQARIDPGAGMAVWWRDFCDPTMDRLMSPNGPFAESSTRSGYDEPLPCDTPPEGLFRDERADGAYTPPRPPKGM